MNAIDNLNLYNACVCEVFNLQQQDNIWDDLCAKYGTEIIGRRAVETMARIRMESGVKMP